MLHADKEALRTAYKLRLLAIREKELNYFLQNCINIATLAAMLAGFAQSGLIYTKYIDKNLCGEREIGCSELLYPIIIIVVMCLSLTCLWSCMLVTMMAPGLALRGPEGSLVRCLDIVAEEYQSALVYFIAALFFFFASAILWSFSRGTHNAVSVLSLIHI